VLTHDGGNVLGGLAEADLEIRETGIAGKCPLDTIFVSRGVNCVGYLVVVFVDERYAVGAVHSICVDEERERRTMSTWLFKLGSRRSGKLMVVSEN